MKSPINDITQPDGLSAEEIKSLVEYFTLLIEIESRIKETNTDAATNSRLP
jgi:hypothetical protein